MYNIFRKFLAINEVFFNFFVIKGFILGLRIAILKQGKMYIVKIMLKNQHIILFY